MTHDEILDAINRQIIIAPPFALGGYTRFLQALRAVVELHKPDLAMYDDGSGCLCNNEYPCPTIKVIEAALND